MDQASPEYATLKSTSEFFGQFLLWAAASRREAIGIFLPLLLFRGQARDENEWPLLGKLARKYYPLFKNAIEDPQISVIAQQIKHGEDQIIDQFRRQFDLKDWTNMEILAYARHHGAPTTLLDWSINPLFALWFAVSEAEHDASDGVVVAMDFMRQNDSDQSESGITVYMNCPDDNSHDCKHAAHIFFSPHRIERSQRQSSAFSKSGFHNALIPFNQLPGAALILQRFVIPAAQKRNVRKLLSLLGLNPFAMYGDPDSFGKTIDLRFELPKTRHRREQ